MNNSELEQQIIEDYRALGGVVKYVADKHGIHNLRIKKILIKNGIEIKNPRLVMTDELELGIEVAIKDGLSYPEVAKKLGLQYGTVKKFCYEQDLIAQKHGCTNTYTEQDIEKIKKLASEGMTPTTISKNTGFSRCAIRRFCQKEKIVFKKGPPKVNIPEAITKLKDMGYTFVENYYENNHLQIKAVHNKCGKLRSATYRSYFRNECKTCSFTGTSKAEIEILDWIKEWYPDARKEKFKSDTGWFEVDIFIPSLNLGIEYCGLYWHSGKPRFYHQNKTQSCEKLGVRLITIFEDEWKSRQSQVKNFLKSVMKITEKVVYARKCKVSQVDLHVAKKFLDNSHIQGNSPSQVAFGLEYEGELIGVMTGNKHHRINDRSIFVLNRMSFKDGLSIVGGASKLLKHLVKYCQDNNYTKLISWSDNRWSQGNVYSKLGFELEENMVADYSYVDKQITKVRISKQACVKKNLIAKGGVGSTERELASSLGLERIYDCGKKRWIKQL